MQALFSAVLQRSLDAAPLIILVLLVRPLLRGLPRKYRYLLWAVPFFRLLTPLSIPRPALFPDTSSAVFQPTVIPTASPTAQQTAGVLPQLADVTPAAAPVLPLSAILAVVWLAVLAALALYGLISIWMLRTQLRDAQPLEPSVYQLDSIRSPFVYGILRPRIYLPRTLTEQELPYILAHERTHIRRGDHLIKPIVWVIALIHWFNPLVWLAVYLLGEDMEQSCDEAVLRDMELPARKAYAHSILRLSAGHLSGIALCFGEHATRSRIQNVLRGRRPSFWGSLIGVLVVALVAAGCLSSPVDKPTETTVSTTEQTADDPLLEQAGMSTADAQALVDTFVGHVLAGESEQAAALFAYPRQLALPGQEVQYCASAEEFLPYYDDIFTLEFIETLKAHQNDPLTSDGMAVRACDGVLWLMEVDGTPMISSVFAASDRYLAYYEGANNTQNSMYTVCGIRTSDANAFFEELLTALREDDRQTVADRIAYPRQLTTSEGTSTLDDSAALLEVYDVLFTPDLIARLEQSAGQLSYNQYGVFAADGALWFSLHGDTLAIDSVAPDETHALRPQSSEITPG